MAGTVWIPEAQDLTASGTSGTMLGGPPRVVWHTTEAPSGFSSAGRAYFDVMHYVLTSKQAEPHILYDPLTDRLGQYFPLNRSSRALRNDTATGTSTNKTGSACIQIEIVAYASKPFTAYWKPGPNFAALMRAIRSWGIPDAWPAGALSRGSEGVSRSLTTWKTRAGHFGHCNVPGNTHWDPGAIDQQAPFRAVAGPIQEDDMPLNDADIGKIWLAATFDPVTGKASNTIDLLKAAVSHAYAGRVAAEQGKAIAEAQAKLGRALSSEDVQRIADATASEVADDLAAGYDLQVTPKTDA